MRKNQYSIEEFEKMIRQNYPGNTYEVPSNSNYYNTNFDIEPQYFSKEKDEIFIKNVVVYLNDEKVLSVLH